MDTRFTACLMVSDRYNGQVVVKKVKVDTRPELYDAVQAALQEMEPEREDELLGEV